MEKRSEVTEWLTPSQFQALARQSKTPAAIRGKGILKDFAPEMQSVDETARRILFRITSGAVDRDKDTIAPAGWETDHYRTKNPVVLWAHCYDSLPVAKSVELTSDANGLTALAEFTPEDLYPFGFMVYRMCREGFLNMCSVGFGPLEWSFDEARGGVNFHRQSLYEFSVCPVGSNPDSLVLARSAGIDLTPLSTWAEETLDGWKKTDSLYVPKAQVEAVYRILSTKTVSIPAGPSADRSAGGPVNPDRIATIGEPGMETLTFSAEGTVLPSHEETDAAPGDAEKSLPTDSVPIGKRGRVLSSANETKLRKSLEHSETACQHVKEVLAQLESAPETDALEITEQRSADPVHIVNIESGKEVNVEIESIVAPIAAPDAITIAPEEIRSAVQGAICDALGPAIVAHVTASINRLRGRVD